MTFLFFLENKAVAVHWEFGCASIFELQRFDFESFKWKFKYNTCSSLKKSVFLFWEAYNNNIAIVKCLTTNSNQTSTFSGQAMRDVGHQPWRQFRRMLPHCHHHEGRHRATSLPQRPPPLLWRARPDAVSEGLKYIWRLLLFLTASKLMWEIK